MLIGVTGGTGFVGRALVEHLITRGHQVRVLARPTSVARLADLPIEIITGDLTERVAVGRMVTGCELVYHMASLVRLWARDERLFEEINVTGTQIVLEAAAAGGVGRVIYTSSVRTLGPTDGRIADETYRSPVRYLSSGYDRTKRAAEALVREATMRGLDAVIVSPSNIYGPPQTEGRIARLLQRIDRGKTVPLVGWGTTSENYVYIEDVIAGHLLAAERGRAGETYILGGENCVFTALVAQAANVVGQPPRMLPCPLMFLATLAVLQESIATVRHSQPALTRLWVDAFRHNWTYTSAKAERELGYHPRSLRDGLTTYWNWLKQFV